ncbi:MAG: hypothetical protein KKH91_00485 [Elusimicrobia bacterium]|nr:hypothetical protein [Elusimicrobiota bacterium]MBU2614792.1 hypothetical protein [Elusimicrobiota bacterium]
MFKIGGCAFKLEVHIIISIAVSSVAYLVFKSYEVAISVLLAGIFIDLDHLFDYFMDVKKITFGFSDFFYRLNEARLKKVYVLLHSYEVLAVFTFIVIKLKTPILLGAYIGVLTHFMADIMCWRAYFYSYSLIYRASVRFDTKKIFNLAGE